MKSRLLLIPAIVAAAAAFGISSSAFSEPRDAQAQAAALLSRPHATETLQTSEHEYARSSSAGKDAQAHAGDLGEHPAVLVARKWSTRGINPNEFIVAHPARLQLTAASPGG